MSRGLTIRYLKKYDTKLRTHKETMNLAIESKNSEICEKGVKVISAECNFCRTMYLYVFDVTVEQTVTNMVQLTRVNSQKECKNKRHTYAHILCCAFVHYARLFVGICVAFVRVNTG